MKQKRFLGFLPLCCLLAVAPLAYGQNSLSLGSDSAEINGGVAVLPLTVDSAGEVQGLVAVFGWTGGGTILSVDPTAALGSADVVVTRADPGATFGALGVVVDADGTGPDALPAGSNHVADVRIECGAAAGSTTVEFVDNAHAMVDGGPLLDNIIVLGGLSIGVSDNLGLNAGTFRCTPPPDRLTIESSGNNRGDRCGSARVLLTNNSPVEGFVTAIRHGAGLELTSIGLGAAAAAADFAASEIDPGVGGTFGVVLDLVDPTPAGVVIPPGSNRHIATYNYCCERVTSTRVDVPLEFVNGELGSPLKDNIIVVGGLSIGVSDGLELVNGTFTCVGEVREICDNGQDDDGDGATDCDDSDCFGTAACPSEIAFVCGPRGMRSLANIGSIEGSRDSDVEVCFGLAINEDNAAGHGQLDHIQGFSMAVTYCDTLDCTSEDLDITGTILEALGAEFVSLQCDNDTADGDGKELIIGVLIDALPPFDGATIAPSFLNDIQTIGCVTFHISADAECGTQCGIQFTDGINGRGRVPIKNLISHENHASTPSKVNCRVDVVEQERFHRGDCNFSLMGSMAVEISDAAAVVSYLFLTGSWRFQPGCLDACDCQDDGRVDLADAVCILQYLFQNGRTPPAPGPGYNPDTGAELQPGPDPTDDKLGCELGKACVLVAH